MKASRIHFFALLITIMLADPIELSAQGPATLQVAKAVIPALRAEFEPIRTRSLKLNRVAHSVHTGAAIADTISVAHGLGTVELTSSDCWTRGGLSACGVSVGEAVIMITPPEKRGNRWTVTAFVRYMLDESGRLGGANYLAVLEPSAGGWKVTTLTLVGAP